MLQFIKGDNFAEYMQVIQDGTVDISEALFLDTVNHRLYLNGEALDVRINVIDEVGENFIKKISYEFVNADGETVRLEDANIPTLDKNYVSTLRDIEGKVDNEFNNGLMSVRDKYLLEAVAAVLGISVSVSLELEPQAQMLTLIAATSIRLTIFFFIIIPPIEFYIFNRINLLNSPFI